MALPGGLSVKSLIGLMFLFIGLLLHIIGLSTPEWSVSAVSSIDHVGLWERCIEGACHQISAALKTANQEACEAFALMGMFAAIAALALGLLNFILAIIGKSQNRLIQVIILAVTSLTLALILICIITWGAGIHDSDVSSIGYSFILSLLGGLFVLVGGLLIYLDAGQVVG